jgi:hypothetical protein
MPRSKVDSLANALIDRFSDVWKLLSETTNFLSRTPSFHQYEHQLRAWRATLQRSPHDGDTMKEVRAEIVELRKSLRLLGYDLTLASQELKFEGFRNDACLRDGFRRVVIFLSDSGTYWLSGEDNHVALSGFLEERLESMGIYGIRERHFLWYRRKGNELVLSGSDTEAKDDFAHLEKIGAANPLIFLSGLKGLR